MIESKGLVAQKVIIDEEEYKMIESIKGLKQEYQKNYDDLKSIRSEIDYCSHLVDQCRQKFMTEFEQWYESIYGGGQSYAQSILNSKGDVNIYFESFRMCWISEKSLIACRLKECLLKILILFLIIMLKRILKEGIKRRFM